MLKLTTIFFIISFFTLAVLHNVAMFFHLYWRFDWFDMPMHLFGGMTVALGVFTLADLIRRFPERLLFFIPVVSLVLLVALAWEVFELYAGIPIQADYELDTSIDLLLGLLGGGLGWYVARAIKTL